MDKQPLRFLALTICTFLIVRIIASQKFEFFLYMTHWALLVKTLAFFSLFMELGSIHFRKSVFIIAWVLGMNVSILYWTYVYPLSTESNSPMWQNFLTHGGVWAFLIPEILSGPFRLTNKDFKGPLIAGLLYSGFIVIPSAFLGIIIYPGLTFRNYLSYVVLFANMLISFGAFNLGKFICNKSRTRNKYFKGKFK